MMSQLQNKNIFVDYEVLSLGDIFIAIFIATSRTMLRFYKTTTQKQQSCSHKTFSFQEEVGFEKKNIYFLNN